MNNNKNTNIKSDELNADDQYDDAFDLEDDEEEEIDEDVPKHHELEGEDSSPKVAFNKRDGTDEDPLENSFDADQWKALLGGNGGIGAPQMPAHQDQAEVKQTSEEEEEEAVGNEIYVWGDDSKGQLGLSGNFGEQQWFDEPQVCSFGIVIKRLACGLSHTIFASDTGFLYSMGCNKYGQLGIGEKEASNQNSPMLISDLMPGNGDSNNGSGTVLQICCGLNHSMALTEKGHVYTWGQGEHGALGNENYSDAFDPQWITQYSEDPVIQISAGGNHSALVTVNGALKICGSNVKGQLGVQIDKDCLSTNQLFCTVDSDVAQVACGESHTMVLLKDGSLYTCGSNEYGQLGRNLGEEEHEANVSSDLCQIETLQGVMIRDIACWNMSACIDSERNLHVWGALIGKQESFQVQGPVQIEGIQIESVQISRSMIAVIEFKSNILNLINCDSSALENIETFNLAPVPELKDKPLDLVALGKSGFLVAIGRQSEGSPNKQHSISSEGQNEHHHIIKQPSQQSYQGQNLIQLDSMDSHSEDAHSSHAVQQQNIMLTDQSKNMMPVTSPKRASLVGLDEIAASRLNASHASYKSQVEQQQQHKEQIARLESIIEQQHEQIKYLEEGQKNKESEIEELHETIKGIEDEKLKNQVQVKLIQEEIKQLKEDKLELEEALIAQKAENEENIEEIKDQHNQETQSLNQQIANLNSQIQILKSQSSSTHSELANSLQQKQDQINNLESQLSQLQQSIKQITASKDQEINQLNERLSLQNSTHEKYIADTQAAASANADKFNKQLEQLRKDKEQQARDYEEVIGHLNEQVMAKEEALDDLRQEISGAESERTALQQNLHKIQSSLSESTKKSLSDKDAQIKQLGVELDKTKKSFSDIENQLQSELAQAQQEIQKLRNTLKEKDTRIASIESEKVQAVQAKDQQIQLIETQSQAQLNQITRDLDQAKAENQTLKKERDVSLKERDQLKIQKEQILAEKNSGLEASKSESTNVKLERDQIKKERDTIRSERDSIKKERDAFQKDRDTIKQERDTLKQERDTLKQERDSIRQERDNLKNTTNKNQQDINELKIILSQKNQELDANKQAKVQQMMTVEKQVKSPRAQSQSPRTVQIEEKNEQIKKLKSEVSSLESALKTQQELFATTIRNQQQQAIQNQPSEKSFSLQEARSGEKALPVQDHQVAQYYRTNEEDAKLINSLKLKKETLEQQVLALNKFLEEERQKNFNLSKLKDQDPSSAMRKLEQRNQDLETQNTELRKQLAEVRLSAIALPTRPSSAALRGEPQIRATPAFINQENDYSKRAGRFEQPISTSVPPINRATNDSYKPQPLDFDKEWRDKQLRGESQDSRKSVASHASQKQPDTAVKQLKRTEYNPAPTTSMYQFSSAIPIGNRVIPQHAPSYSGLNVRPIRGSENLVPDQGRDNLIRLQQISNNNGPSVDYSKGPNTYEIPESARNFYSNNLPGEKRAETYQSIDHSNSPPVANAGYQKYERAMDSKYSNPLNYRGTNIPSTTFSIQPREINNDRYQPMRPYTADSQTSYSILPRSAIQPANSQALRGGEPRGINTQPNSSISSPKTKDYTYQPYQYRPIIEQPRPYTASTYQNYKPITPILRQVNNAQPLRYEGEDKSRTIINEGGSLIQGIKSKLETLERNKLDLQAKISSFESKMHNIGFQHQRN